MKIIKNEGAETVTGGKGYLNRHDLPDSSIGTIGIQPKITQREMNPAIVRNIKGSSWAKSIIKIQEKFKKGVDSMKKIAARTAGHSNTFRYCLKQVTKLIRRAESTTPGQTQKSPQIKDLQAIKQSHEKNSL